MPDTLQKHTIGITSRSFRDLNDELLDLLSDYNIVKNNTGNKLTEDEIIELLPKNTIGIIAGTEPITKKVMDELPNLRVISRNGVGLDNIDLDYAESKNILIRTTESHASAVAEHAIALMFYWLKNLDNPNEKVLNSKLGGKNVGIIGYGSVGHYLKYKLERLGCNVYYYDPAYTESCDFDYLITNSDIISINCSLNDETCYLLSSNEFMSMKKNTIVINTSRAEVIDETAIVEAINIKNIRFGLDVLDDKNIADSNIVYTPHVASYCKETRNLMEREAVDNLVKNL